MRTIVIGTDGSKASQEAARLGATLAASYGARVVLLRAVRPVFIPGDVTGQVQMVADLNRQETALAQREVEAEARGLAGEGGPLPETRVAQGDPAAELAAFAEEHPEVGLVVVGATGKGLVDRVLLGSVPYRLTHLSPAPVLIVPGEARSIRKILVPVDFSEASRRAVLFAQELGRRTGATLELLHAWEPPWSFAPEVMLAIPDQRTFSMLEYGERAAGAAMKELTTALALKDAPARLQQGVPAKVILQAAEQGGFDLIVMGTHGRGFFKRMVLGNVAHRVVAGARCPVIVVPGSAEAASSGRPQAA